MWPVKPHISNLQGYWDTWEKPGLTWSDLRKKVINLKPKVDSRSLVHFLVGDTRYTWNIYYTAGRRAAPCGLRGCKNGPAPFPGRMSYKATKPGLVFVLYLSMFFYCVGVY